MTSTETAPATARTSAAGFDFDSAWQLHPAVSVRPEPFGALLYHFGNRRLSFLKTRQLLDIVQKLDDAPTARVACAQAGVLQEQLPAIGRALTSLHAGETIRPRPEKTPKVDA